MEWCYSQDCADLSLKALVDGSVPVLIKRAWAVCWWLQGNGICAVRNVVEACRGKLLFNCSSRQRQAEFEQAGSNADSL